MRAEIEQQVELLRASLIETPDDDCISTWMPCGTLPFGTCTNSARWLAERLGGKVMGYTIESNPTAELGQWEYGHDFCVLPDYIVDLWAKETWEKPAVLHREQDAELIARLYGDPARWEELPLS